MSITLLDPLGQLVSRPVKVQQRVAASTTAFDWLPDRRGWWLLLATVLAHATLIGGLATSASRVDRVALAPALQGVLLAPVTTLPSPRPMGDETPTQRAPQATPRPSRDRPQRTPPPAARTPTAAPDPAPYTPTADSAAPVAPPAASAAPTAAAPLGPATAPGPEPASPRPAPVPMAAPAPAEEALALPHADASHLSNPKPRYPPESRRRREQGAVVLDVHILPDGSVAEVRVRTSSGHARLDAAAADAVRQWRYAPARRGGTPIDFWYEQPIVFALQR